MSEVESTYYSSSRYLNKFSIQKWDLYYYYMLQRIISYSIYYWYKVM